MLLYFLFMAPSHSFSWCLMFINSCELSYIKIMFSGICNQWIWFICQTWSSVHDHICFIPSPSDVFLCAKMARDMQIPKSRFHPPISFNFHQVEYEDYTVNYTNEFIQEFYGACLSTIHRLFFFSAEEWSDLVTSWTKTALRKSAASIRF